MNTEYFLTILGKGSYFRLEDTTMNHKIDWIEDCFQTYNDGNWITKRTFKKTAVTKGDHYHCLFDAKRLSQYDYSNSEKQGYCSTDGRIWFCKDCFEKVQQKHKLSVVKNTIETVENALRHSSNVIISLNNEQYFLKNENDKIVVKHNGFVKIYDDILSMEREQLFYSKPLREIIDDIFIGVV